MVLLTIVQSSCGDDESAPALENYPWETCDPESLGLDPQTLDSAFVHAKELGFVDCLLVVRYGCIAGERYYNGWKATSAHDVKSVSKSFLSALAGIAIEEGAIGGPWDSVLAYFPEYIYDGMEARKHGITIRHLLTMRMGIGDEDDTFERVILSSNWIREIIRLPLVDDPGARFRYNTVQTHLLSGVLTRGAGESLLAFANEFLFGPMNISIAEWTRDPQGYCFGGGEMWFTPRNMAALGLLYLNEGSLGGDQIVPAEWIDSSLVPTWSEDVPGTGPLKNYNYGFLWWLGEIGGQEIFMALGYAGQTVIVFPALDMIVVTTARTDTPAGVDQETAILGIVEDDILAAVQ